MRNRFMKANEAQKNIPLSVSQKLPLEKPLKYPERQFFSIKKAGLIKPCFFGLEFSKFFQGQLWFG
jgi:hypothetical protein